MSLFMAEMELRTIPGISENDLTYLLTVPLGGARTREIDNTTVIVTYSQWQRQNGYMISKAGM
jgi:hypothetical protein